MKNLYLITLSLVLFSACSKEVITKKANSVPETWYASDKAPQTETDDFNDPQKLEKLGETLDTILAANAEALESGDADARAFLSPMALNLNSTEGKPKDWVPWRAEYFMTDLSITASGLAGVLSLKGTATNRLFWRRQGPSEKKALDFELQTDEDFANQEPVIMVQEDASANVMVKQLEPAIHAAVTTGKIKDTPELRKNMLQAAQEFQAIASAIPSTNEELPWWVSRFRLDFTVDAAGRVEPVGMVGGEARFRFEWHRIRRTQKTLLPMAAMTERQLRIRKSLQDFVTATATDLEDAFGGHSKSGFQAHQMRMGIGITVKGNIGVVKGAAGVVGQIYFTRHVERPKLRPPTTQYATVEPTIFVIERNPSQDTLNFAVKNNISLETNSVSGGSIFEEAVYKLDRKVFRKGIMKAAKISKFFADRVHKVKPGAWKVYELRTAFDASISGGLDVVTLVGSVTAQISMFNQNF